MLTLVIKINVHGVCKGLFELRREGKGVEQSWLKTDQFWANFYLLYYILPQSKQTINFFILENSNRLDEKGTVMREKVSCRKEYALIESIIIFEAPHNYLFTQFRISSQNFLNEILGKTPTSYAFTDLPRKDQYVSNNMNSLE